HGAPPPFVGPRHGSDDVGDVSNAQIEGWSRRLELLERERGAPARQDFFNAAIRSSVPGCVAKKPPPLAPSVWVSQVSVLIMTSLEYPARLRMSTPWRSAWYSSRWLYF